MEDVEKTRTSVGDKEKAATSPPSNGPKLKPKPTPRPTLDPTAADPASPNSGAPNGAPLRPVLSTRSARSATSARAAHTLETFEHAPENPRNWPSSAKWRTTLTVAVTGFLSTCGSSIAVPGIHAMMEEFGYTNEKVGVLVTACYVLGLGAGPFLFAPISELYGRQMAYQTSQACYVFFCLATAVAPNMIALIILRFFCGVFGSVGPALGVATCADVFAPHERGRPVSIYALGPMSGPVVGSMTGYWIMYGGWRWLMWAITLMAAVNWVLLVSLTEETFAPVIQMKLEYRVSHPQPEPTSFADRLSPSRFLESLAWTTTMVSSTQARAVFRRAFSRPPRLLFGNPVALIFCLYYAYIYGVIYVFLVSIPLLFGAPPFTNPPLFAYNWPQAVLPLGYLGMGVGFLLAAATAATAQDRIYRHLSKRNNDAGEPEYRLVLTQIGMLIMPLGLLIFGWTAHAQTHWIGPLVAQAVIAYGLMVAFNSIQNYLVDAFFPYSAAATAAATAARSVTACIMPIFSAQMFGAVGWGWGGTLLALVAALAVPTPLVMFRYGNGLRERFAFVG